MSLRFQGSFCSTFLIGCCINIGKGTEGMVIGIERCWWIHRCKSSEPQFGSLRSRLRFARQPDQKWCAGSVGLEWAAGWSTGWCEQLLGCTEAADWAASRGSWTRSASPKGSDDIGPLRELKSLDSLCFRWLSRIVHLWRSQGFLLAVEGSSRDRLIQFERVAEQFSASASLQPPSSIDLRYFLLYLLLQSWQPRQSLSHSHHPWRWSVPIAHLATISDGPHVSLTWHMLPNQYLWTGCSWSWHTDWTPWRWYRTLVQAKSRWRLH